MYKRQEEARLAERRKRAGIPKRFLGATVQHQDLIDYLESFEGSAGRGLYIYGSVGRGKSYSAAALANAFVDAGYRTVFTTASAMLERIKASFSGNGETDSVISRYAACDVLVLSLIHIYGAEKARTVISKESLHIVNHAFYSALSENIIHAKSVEELNATTEVISTFFNAGWEKYRTL